MRKKVQETRRSFQSVPHQLLEKSQLHRYGAARVLSIKADYNTISASATFGGSDPLDSIVECTSYPKNDHVQPMRRDCDSNALFRQRMSPYGLNNPIAKDRQLPVLALFAPE